MSDPRQQPNVVVVLADDMGWGDLGCNGATAIPTPAMDAVAAAGARFTDAHSASSVCSPSRYALLTGRYAWRSPLKSGVLMGHSPSLIEADRPTMATMLRSAGYATGAFGKWHLGVGWRWRDGHVETVFGPNGRFGSDAYAAETGLEIDYGSPFTEGPTERGFDRFFGIAASLDMAPYCFLDQDRTLGIPDRAKEVYGGSQRPGLQTEGWQDDQVDVRVTEETVSWIREQAQSDQPFFCYVAPAAPHRPCVPPEFVRGRTGIGDRADAVCLVDWMVGEIDRTLTELGIADSTLLVVTSDNGAPTIYPEDGRIEDHPPNGPYRGQKADLWEGGHREPLLIRWPGHIEPGTTVDHPVCLVDLYATVSELCDADPLGGGEDSVSRAAILTADGAATESQEDEIIVHHSLRGLFAVRSGRWKCVFSTGSGGGFTRPRGVAFDQDHPIGQLYDLQTDPYERVNLWDQHPDLVQALYGSLQRLCADDETGFPIGVQL
jgi:arylsulfatase A